VICRGGYESAECPSGRNIILNDDIGGARGAAETAARAFHVRGVTARNENHGECARVDVCTWAGSVAVVIVVVIVADERRPTSSS